MRITLPSPAHKCLQARNLLLQVDYLRCVYGDEVAAKAQRYLDRLQFRAENLAGEAGFDAATDGFSGQVPECIQPYKVLANAFTSDYTQVIDHLRLDTASAVSINT